ncbi:MAG: DEAD/DEAH box helicase [Anaerolineae bacterium]|mgnify:CR=1 FL=1|nr:DEAD/DEAH box helicase [Anaerolineae bacterium]
MPREYVAVDLETTGLDPQYDSIIEVGAVRFSDSGPGPTFSSLVSPGRLVPAKIQHLTGITNEDLSHAPAATDVMRRLADFVGRDPVVGHNIGFDISFLARFGVAQRNRRLDTFEISTILMPHMARHSLQHLVGELHLSSDSAHRALDDAQASMRLFQALREAALALPVTILDQIVELGRKSAWEQAAFFEDVLREQNRRPASNSIAQQLAAKGGLSASGLLAEAPPLGGGIGEPVRPPTALDTLGLIADLEPGGRVAAAMNAYEHRPQQLDMLDAVCEAFNDGEHLVVEAATGVGKSLAYLLPALTWARVNHDRVVVSTHTINLQEQLFSKDVPQLAQALGGRPSVAILKGRNNYLCPARLRTLTNRPSHSPEQALALAKIMVWAPTTATGDRSELFLNTAPERSLWSQIASDNSWCSGEACRFRQRGGCYYQRARQLAQQSELVIVNHSLLSLDVCQGTESLPEFEHLVIDEAHHFQNACTNALRLDLTVSQITDILRSLSSTERGANGGAIGRVRAALARSRQGATEGVLACTRLTEALGALEPRLDAAATHLDHCAGALLSASANGFTQQRRITESERNTAEWAGLAETWKDTAESAGRVARLLEEVRKSAAGLSLNEALSESVQAIAAGAMQLRESVAGFSRAILEPAAGEVYWLSSREGQEVSLHSAPVSVADSLAESLFATKRTVIMTSATLTTAGSFGYFQEQMGLESVRTVTVGSPFDFRNAALVCVARDVPEPRQPGHQRAVEEYVLRLARATGGRLMALFTSYSQLRQTTRALAGALEDEGILLYSQSEGGSRNQLLEGFKSSKRAVLLGTRSFWEGVDVPGDALQCLVMAKLPFLVPDDPVVSARREQYLDSFGEYLLPEAILTFRQGFGRLIRTQSDQGAFVILDSRVRSKAYGTQFLQSLPDCSFLDGTIDSIPTQVVGWLSGGDPR